MEFAGIIFLAVMVEGLVTYGSAFCSDGKCKWKMLSSIILGIIVAINFQLDIFSFIGLESNIPYMSMILTGIIVGRGSNYVSDFLHSAQQYLGK